MLANVSESLQRLSSLHRICNSVISAAKLIAVLWRAVRVTAGLADSNSSLPPGLWLTSPAGWLPRTGGQLRNPIRSVIDYGLPFTHLQCPSSLFYWVAERFGSYEEYALSPSSVGGSASRARSGLCPKPLSVAHAAHVPGLGVLMPCRTAHSVDPQHGKEEDERNGTRRGKRSFLLQNTPMHNYRPQRYW